MQPTTDQCPQHPDAPIMGGHCAMCVLEKQMADNPGRPIRVILVAPPATDARHMAFVEQLKDMGVVVVDMPKSEYDRIQKERSIELEISRPVELPERIFFNARETRQPWQRPGKKIKPGNKFF